MASLIAFDLLRFRAGGRAPKTRSIFSDASSVDYDDAVHAVCTHANQGMIKSTAKPYIVVGEGMCPAAACRSCPTCAGRRSRSSANSAADAGVRSSSLLPAQVGAAGPSPQSVALCAT